MDWYTLTLLSFGFYVIQGVIMKYIAQAGCDRNLTTLYSSIVVSLVSLPIIFLKMPSQLVWVGIFAAVINGLSYAISTITRLGALEELPLSIVYPVVRINNAIVVVLLVLFLGETVTPLNVVGILLATASVYFITRGEEK